jgi:hypothetical protein
VETNKKGGLNVWIPETGEPHCSDTLSLFAFRSPSYNLQPFPVPFIKNIKTADEMQGNTPEQISHVAIAFEEGEMIA